MKNKIENDRLKDIFAKVKSESPSMSFENNLMQHIRAKHLLVERRKSRVALLSMIFGIVGVIIIPFVVLHFFGWSTLDVLENSNVLYLTRIDSLTISISLVCLLLLMADLFIRRHLSKKERK